jgi:hypothetical protein
MRSFRTKRDYFTVVPGLYKFVMSADQSLYSSAGFYMGRLRNRGSKTTPVAGNDFVSFCRDFLRMHPPTKADAHTCSREFDQN